MAEIYNLKELNELGRNLEFYDKVFFTTRGDKFKEVLGYIINSDYLEDITYCSNYALIFNYLGLDNSKKYKLAEKCYGYKSPENWLHEHNWPHYNKNDFLALERLIREIYKMLGDNSTEVLDPKELITNRFEILDL